MSPQNNPHLGPVESGIMVFIKVSLASLLCFHLTSVFLGSPARRVPGVRQLWLFFSRAAIVSQAKYRESAGWASQRIAALRRRRRGVLQLPARLAEELRILLETAVAIMGQMVQLVLGLSATTAARGGFPQNDKWIATSRPDTMSWWAITLGDMLLVSGLLICSSYELSAFAPDVIQSAVEGLFGGRN
jgi:hypothetical protein